MEKGKVTTGTPDYICTGYGEKTQYKDLHPEVGEKEEEAEE